MAEDSAAAQQQFAEYWAWSRFYHDAEIKVNSGSVFVAALGSLTKEFSESSLFAITICGRELSTIGLIIMIASVAALLSTLGYWRYYEFCDIYAKAFRNTYMTEEFLKTVKKEVKENFNSRYRILSLPMFVNVHHTVWIVVQIALFILGFLITIHGGAEPGPGTVGPPSG